MILATDLDGTFLGGSEEEQARLYNAIREHASATLIYVTGRGLESILPLLSDPRYPRPDYIIADVGATVVRGDTLESVQPLQAEIARRWPGTHRILRALSRFDYLERQDVPQERRVSFYVNEEEIGDDLREAVKSLGCDLLFSAGKYLDVLPSGVSKGTTLDGLIEQEGMDGERVVVAGDTLNDLSLYETDYQRIVVGNAEQPLLDALSDTTDLFRAKAHGAGGIFEGLSELGFLDQDGTIVKPAFEDGEGKSQLVMVYHRLPFEEVERDGKLYRRRPKSPNGIIPTLLGFFSDGRRGSWVAWSKRETRNPEGFRTHVEVDPEAYPHLTAARIPLTPRDVKLFYETFSKEAFWPVIFSFPGKAVFNENHWNHYVEINRIFAHQAAREAEKGALVWVHDYNLWLVPGMLRALRPDVRIAFFHHTAFPPSDIFNIIPWRREIISSLVQCDYVGFHIPRYVENFVDVVRTYAPVEVLERTNCAPRFMTYGTAMGVDTMKTAIRLGDRVVRMGAHPVGINVEGIEEILRRDSVKDSIQSIESQVGHRTCILSVERLDYVKGPLEKLHAFEELLEQHPELHGEIVLINICTPPAPGMQVYRRIREKVDETVGRINGRFSKLDWLPVRYFFRSLSFEDVIAYYAVSDVAWITPLRDGLNMVAKEYVATQSIMGRTGVLVLSEFAGAAVELHGAILTNPYDATSMQQSLYRAMQLTNEDRETRMERLDDIVRANDIKHWGDEFLAAAMNVDVNQEPA